MKTTKLLTLIASVLFAVSCNTDTNKAIDDAHNHEADAAAHTHEGDAAHTHEADAAHTHEADSAAHTHEADDAAHTHEADAAHTHEGDSTHTHEADAAHTHEADAAHTHEGDATHTHEADAAHTHEADAAHTHEADTAAHTNEADAAAHTHEADAAAQQQTAAPIEHKSLQIMAQEFHFVKKTSGQILIDNKDEIVLTAKSAGIVRFDNHYLFPGSLTKKGETLFTIKGESLTTNNTELNFARVESDYNKAKLNFDRAASLIEDKLITQEHFLDVKNEYEKVKKEYEIFKTNSGGNASRVKSPSSAYIKEVFVKEGQMVEPGDKLASIIIENKMILKAEVAPLDFGIIEEVKSAKFATGYTSSVYNTLKMNGNIISYGRSSGENSFYIPIYFSIDYSKELIPGSFADIWLIGKSIDNAIVIPNISIMEEFGRFYVFIDHGDHFDKRFLTLGQSDGERTLVLDGLKETETIVTEGVYQVKMSMMTSVPNTHDHSH